MSWLGMWAYQAARHDHWYDKLFVDENLLLGEYGDGEPDNPLPDWLVNKKVEFDTWPVQDNWLEPAEGQDLPGLYIGEHFKQMPIRSTGLPLENNFIRDNWIIYETGYTDSLGVYGDRVLALLEDNNWIKNEILADGTAYAIEQMHLIMRLLFQYREFAKLEEEQQQSAEYLENIKSMVDAQMALPNKMKTVVESSLDSLISKGYFDGVNWGLRLSYIAMSYNLPDVYKDRAKEEYDNSDIQYLEGMGGLTNISGAPQHKIEVHKDGGFYFYYTIPIIEKEISITEKFKTENEGDVSLSDSSIYSLFTSKQAMVEDPDMSYIEDFYFKHVHQTLVDQIKASEEYNSLFDYALPMRRYVTLNSINIMMTMTKIGPGPLMYISTRDILQSIISSAINGSGPEGFEFDDPQLTALGGNAGMFSDAFNSKNFEPKKMNLGAMILKLFLETPFKILKGITEAFDPNISIIDKIMKVLKTIIELLPTKADPCIVEPVFIGYIGDYLSENNLPEGYGLPADLLQELREQAQTDMDRKLRKIKNTLKDVLDNMPVPLISVAMLPSMLPYGCGFPPPPLGPGIGPPLTPFGVAYLVLGLYRDIDFGKMNDISQRSEKDDLPDDIEILCKEKHEAYQRLVAQGAFDFPPSDDDD